MNKKTLTLILIGLAVADLLGAIDATGVNIALPNITRDLGIPISLSQWIPNAYTLVLVSTLLFMGKLGDIVGVKKLYIIGLAIFGVASLVLGFINNPYALIIVRALQGLGTAILYTMPMSIIAHLWKEREKAFAVTASFFAGGMLLGPIIGGLFTNFDFGNFHGWHLLFLLNIPFIVFGLIISAKYIPQLVHEKTAKLDILSIVLLFAGLITIVLSLTMISRFYAIAGLIILVTLYYYERRVRHPLLDINLFKNSTFTAANLVSFSTMVSVIGMSFVLTFYLQDIVGWNSMTAGLAMLPVPIATGVVAAISGKLRNWKLGAILTAVLTSMGLALFVFADPSISYFKLVLPALIVIAAGSGFLMTAGFASILGSAPTEKSGSASGILNTLQQLGSLIGIALVASITLKYNLAFTVLLIASLLGLISAFFVKNRKTPQIP